MTLLFFRFWHLGVYALAWLLTSPFYQADIREYSRDIIGYGNDLPSSAWEFGHLLLRPFLFVLHQAFGSTLSSVFDLDPERQVSALLIATAGLFGAVSVHTLRGILQRLSLDRVSPLILPLFIFSLSFLNFSQAGTSYVYALCFLLLGLRHTLEVAAAGKRAVIAALCFSIAIAWWATSVFAIPGLIVGTALLPIPGATRPHTWVRTARLVALTMGSSVVMFGSGALLAGVDSLPEARQWVISSSHGVELAGVHRSVWGFPRSVVHMGDLALQVKRYLLNDPYNPTSLLDLALCPIWMIACFYVVLLTLAWILARKRDFRPYLAFAILSSGPVLCFAALFDGAAVERYLPLYPALFLFLAAGINASSLLTRRVLSGFVVVIVATNGYRLSIIRTASEIVTIEQALRPAVMEAKPYSRYVVLNLQDPFEAFNRTERFHPLNAAGRFHPYTIMDEMKDRRRWRASIHTMMISTWNAGGDVWVSKDLLLARPPRNAYWAEGEHPIRWADLVQVMRELSFDRTAGAFLRVKHDLSIAQRLP